MSVPPAARRQLPFLALAAAAAAAAAFVWFAMPHEREVTALWVLLVKLLPFVLATEAVARLDLAAPARRRLAAVALPVAFLVFFCFFVPRIFFYSDDGPTLYYYVLTLTPVVILSLVLAYRLGGGPAGGVRRLAYAMLLLMLSGVEDLAFLTVNPHTDPKWTPIPEVWSWASHMTVFLGHPPTKYEAYGFIAVHVALAALVLFLPGRVLRAVRLPVGRGRRIPHAAER
jgi:hypothetical protein